MFRTFALISLLCAATFNAHAAKTPQTAAGIYEDGLRYLKRGYFTKALETFQRVRTYYRDDPASVLAQLAIADVHFRKGDYEQARYAYDEFATYHPRHETMDYVVYRIGLSVYRRAPKMAGRDQAATRSAVNAWAGYEVRFPESQYLDEVQQLRSRSRERLALKELQIAQFYAQRDAWGAVKGRCEDLAQRYGDTTAMEPALALLGEALHAWGDTEGAVGARDRLMTDYPDSKWLKPLNSAMAKPAGTPPEERAVFRPYRIQGGMQQPPAR